MQLGRRVGAAVLIGFLPPIAALLAQPLHAQPAEAGLSVLVRTSDTGQPLVSALVLNLSGETRAVTDANGIAHITNLAAGSHQMLVRHLGYKTDTITVEIEPGRSTRVAVGLEIDPILLAEIRVLTRRSRLEQTGFNGRSKAGFGTFVTREEIVLMRPRFLSDVLRRVAGVNLSPTRVGGTSRASMRGSKVITGDCPIQYYVDGMMAYINVDDVRPEDVEGIEIYRGAATIPTLFNKGSALCGVVVIWTRDR
jgi:hypothetical protein